MGLDLRLRDLPASRRRWVLLNAIAITALVNGVLNALPAWLATREQDHVPLWTFPFNGETGLYTDILGTLLILPFVTTVLCTTAVWRARRRGGLPPLRRLPRDPLPGSLRRAPRRP